MKVNCDCIANYNGRCMAPACRGPIKALDAKLNTPEARAMLYSSSVKAFTECFGPEKHKNE